jgi:hypothetical protein
MDFRFEEPGVLSASLWIGFTSFLSITLLTYRISLLKQRKINWFTLALTVMICGELVYMHLNKPIIPFFWRYVVIQYCILITFVLITSIKPKGLITKITKGFTLLNGLLLILILSLKLSGSLIFTISLGATTLTSLLLITQMMIKPSMQ